MVEVVGLRRAWMKLRMPARRSARQRRVVAIWPERARYLEWAKVMGMRVAEPRMPRTQMPMAAWTMCLLRWSLARRAEPTRRMPRPVGMRAVGWMVWCWM